MIGGYPTYDDNAYFIQPNCELISIVPENCIPDNPLDWNLGNVAIKVYAVTELVSVQTLSIFGLENRDWWRIIYV